MELFEIRKGFRQYYYNNMAKISEHLIELENENNSESSKGSLV
jgi:hypothetical protein